MSRGYDPASVEAKWRKRWEEANAYHVNLEKAKDPYYSLVMFPYPSGDKLHVGHWYNYGPADSYSRFMRMHGKEVFSPMGFDAFGLPAENNAIKTRVHPDTSTKKNVQTMIEQLKRIGCMYDWSKTLNTSTPEYYRWTQWLFLQMFEHGLAYRKEAAVNWCPSCQTVLANEQVDEGKCERCGTEVIQKLLTQWFWGITKYAERLLQGLENIDWPEKTKLMQRNWIGKSEGAEIAFSIEQSPEVINVFTTRPDTLFGATYLVLAPEHPLLEKITDHRHLSEVEAYRREVKKKTELERTDLAKVKNGVPTGAHAINPATGEPIPIWIADYVLATYGTGAIMAVPGHDERDWEFAKKFKLPIREVVIPLAGDAHRRLALDQPFIADGRAVNSDFLNGLATHEAKMKMISWLEDKGKGQGMITYRLRDWLVSRQRYWGSPIPIAYDPQGAPHPIPEKHLPWLLPTDVEFLPQGESPLKLSKEFKERTEKLFGKGWTPEYDTMDTFVCSSFYYLRYLMAEETKNQKLKTKNQFVDPTLERTWMPVDLYIGGPEHATMHLIYARFVMMALKDFGIVSHDEPFKKLVHQGLITNRGAKMSKSRGNVVSPDEFVARFGSDVFRMYLMFMGPFTDGGDWSDAGIRGIERFVERSWRAFGSGKLQAVSGKQETNENPELHALLHATIKKVGEDIEKLHFNTAISALMEFLNFVEKQPTVARETKQTVAKLLAPLAPHLAEELWEASGGSGFVIDQRWPVYDPKLLVSSTLTIVIQVNGKLRANIEVSKDAPEQEIIAKAKEHENVQKFLEGKKPKKEIYVRGRLVNFVI